MTSNAGADCSDLVQTAESGRKVQDLIDGLVDGFSMESIQNKEGWAKVECSSKVLSKVREEFKKEFERSEKVDAEIPQESHKLTSL
jgi:DNA-directed RNA polymerase subunit RPC12/RpoP